MININYRNKFLAGRQGEMPKRASSTLQAASPKSDEPGINLCDCYKFFLILIALIATTPAVYFQNLYANEESSSELIPKISRGPYLQNLNPSGVTIRWETLRPSSSEIELDGKTIGSTGLSQKHRIKLTNLESGRSYSYKIKNTLENFSFTTTPTDPNSSFNFTVWGDSQDRPGTFSQIADLMLAFEPHFSVGVGDYVNNGPDLTQWDQRFFSPAARFLSQVPTFLAIGNHDYGYNRNNQWDFTTSSQGLKIFQNFFEGPAGTRTYYSFNYGGNHFIVLDPNLGQSMGAFDIPINSEQHRWLIDDLNSHDSRCARFRIVFFHEPAFINYWDGGYWDGEPKLRQNLIPLLEKYNIHLAFSGHAHVYERGILNNVTYITTGGGGGNLDLTQYRDWEHILIAKPIHHYVQVRINGNELDFAAITSEGDQIDQATILSNGGCQ